MKVIQLADDLSVALRVEHWTGFGWSRPRLERWGSAVSLSAGGPGVFVRLELSWAR